MSDQGNWYGAFKAAQKENEALRAENAELRKDAERWRYINNENCEWRRQAGDGQDKPYAMLCVRLPYDTDLNCKAMREIAIDAALKENSNG